MKKTILLIIFIVVFYISISNVISSNNIKIPNEAIRIRVIANSNSKLDQNIKFKVKDSVQNLLTSQMVDVENIEEARKKIVSNINNIDRIINNLFDNNSYDLPYDIKYGYNYFPKKEYKGVIYEEGYYESLLITLGKGLGDNWWCLLFPPLCLLEGEETNLNDVEYKSYIKELIDKYI